MSGVVPPDPLEGQFADVELIRAAVLDSVDHGIWTGTGGTDGCALCKPKTFRERIADGHLICAEELARAEGARSVKYGMTCGDLNARLFDVVTDPRLGGWRRHLDAWSKQP